MTDRNAKARERRANDPEYRTAQTAKSMRYQARKKAIAAGEPIPESAAIRQQQNHGFKSAERVEDVANPRDKLDMWIFEMWRLNSDNPAEVQLARENVRRHMTMILHANERARDLINRSTASENGLADDID